MNDEPSLGELGRLILALRTDVRDDMALINQRLDRLVSMDVYTVEKAALAKDINDLVKVIEQLSAKQQADFQALQQLRERDQEQRQRDADRITQTRRWMVGAVLIPLVGFVVPVVMFLMSGGKS